MATAEINLSLVRDFFSACSLIIEKSLGIVIMLAFLKINIFYANSVVVYSLTVSARTNDTNVLVGIVS